MPIDVLDRLLRPLRRGPVTAATRPRRRTLPPAARGLPELDAARCDASAACVDGLPDRGDPAAAAGDVVRSTPGACIFCGACARACPRDAIRLGRPDRARGTNARRRCVIVTPIERPESSRRRRPPAMPRPAPSAPASTPRARSRARDPPPPRAVAPRPPPGRRLVQRLRLGDRGAAQPVPRRPAPGDRLRRVARGTPTCCS